MLNIEQNKQVRGDFMGEIVVSILIGGCLVFSGVVMIVTLKKEEAKWSAEENKEET